MRAAIVGGLLVGLSVSLGSAHARAQAADKSSPDKSPAVKTLTVQDVFNLQLASDPQISPDGRRIVYVRQFCDIMADKRHSNLWIIDVNGSNHRPLTTGNFNDTSPRWSHDGTQLIYGAADGKGIYFASAVHGNTGLYFIDLDGHVQKLAGDIGSTTSAYGGLPTFSVAKDGTFAVPYTRPDVPGEIAVSPDNNTNRSAKLNVLTRVNEGLFSDKQLGPVEEIWYESSKDHRKIQGWIIKPPGFNPKKKYPLILEIHGGPFANYGDRFDLEKQLMAARGYVVLYTNPRGSTSYGGEFGNLIHHAYPGDDFADLNSGVDAVIARGYVDPQQLFVTGGSGGGVLTCWVIGHTTRFRAAVTVYPVINWYSFVLTSDIGGWIYKYWFPGLPWDNVAHYEKRSLLSVVKNVKTPTMVLTGEADYRTPMSDSEQYY
jgi:dipeptidyl aminopeptidase/acylaminoacyl peptidase